MDFSLVGNFQVLITRESSNSQFFYLAFNSAECFGSFTTLVL